MTYTYREYGRCEDLILAWMYNGIKSMFDFDMPEGGTRKRKGLINWVGKQFIWRWIKIF